MTATPTSGADDLPEALRRSTAADGKTELFNLHGYPLMVRAVDFNRLHAESEMRRTALLDEMQKAAPTAQAQGWQSIETAPKEGVFLVFIRDEVRPARRMQVANWHPNVKIVGGLFAFDCAKVTHWMPLPNPPTSAEGVEHG